MVAGVKTFPFELPLSPSPMNKTSEVSEDLKNIIDAIYILATRSFGGMGTTANRPQLTPEYIGVLYLDTTLAMDGKPIWWNGVNWVDYSGTVV